MMFKPFLVKLNLILWTTYLPHSRHGDSTTTQWPSVSWSKSSLTPPDYINVLHSNLKQISSFCFFLQEEYERIFLQVERLQ